MGVDGGGDETTVRRWLRLSSRHGRIEVVAEERSDVVVEKGGRSVDVADDGPITVSSRSAALLARVPFGTDVVVGTASGRAKLTGRLGKVALATVSGRVTVETAAAVEIRTVSARVEVGSCEGDVRVDSLTGRVTVGRAGSVWLSTKTGRATVEAAHGSVRVRTVTGRVTVGIAEGPVDARLETVSGRIELSVPDGVRPAQRFTARHGSIRSGVAEGDDGTVRGRTVSGAIRLSHG